jgi:DNA-binding response OmpR family regulator
MTQADCVYSTPPTNTPVDPTRRHFLSVGAAPSAASARAKGTADATDLLRVGSLELDLINRTARRGDRSFDLQPREVRLLKYMMQRCGQVLTRAKLLEDVWNYKFVPEESNLVDVHMGKLRRKVDGLNEAPMIRSVRGAGFILNATEDAAHELDRAGKAVQS